MFKNCSVTTDEDSQIIFTVNQVAEGRYLGPSLLSYPVLSLSGPLVTLVIHDGGEFLSLTSDTLSHISGMSGDHSAYVIIPDSGMRDVKLIQFGYAFVIFRKDVGLVLLNPALYSPEHRSDFFVYVVPPKYDIYDINNIQKLITTS